MDDEDLERFAPCSSVAADSIIRVGTAGAIWGILSGPYDARERGLTGAARASFVAKSVGYCGFQCGLVAGIFASTRCGLRRYRDKDDLVNSLVAGAVAGAAIAGSTRSWNQVMKISCIVAVFSAAVDYSRIF